MFSSFFKKYLPRTYHGPSVILGGEETSGNKVPTFKDGGGERNADNKQMLLHAYFYEEKWSRRWKRASWGRMWALLHGGYQGNPQWWLKGWVRTSKSRCAQGAARSLVLPQQSEKGRIKGDKTWRSPEVSPWEAYLPVLECWLLHWKRWKAPRKCWSEEGHNVNYLDVNRITLAAVWRIRCRETNIQAQRPMNRFSSVQFSRSVVCNTLRPH